ncbi:MAG: FAD:protein FMN transferase, partial [Lachnospiraceae bacterium]|nr:FAD:protein FMN transferase [Candidatus Equihabitans merdae]
MVGLLVFLCLAIGLVVGIRKNKAADVAAHEESFFAMDTYMTVTCYGRDGQEAAVAARNELERLDQLLSAVDSDSSLKNYSSDKSEILYLNQHESGQVGPEVTYMLELANTISERTDGAYDVTVAPLVELWGFTSGNYRVPSPEEITEALEKVDYSQIKIESLNSGQIGEADDADADSVTENHGTGDDAASYVFLGEGQRIGLGSIAKGYASAAASDLVRSQGIESAILSLGGNIQCVGTKPDGSLWKVGVRDPRDRNDQSKLMGTLMVSDLAVITSGTYERYFEGQDGRIFHHILDPKTGYPAENGMLSVTIVSQDAAMADALSTACFVLGPEGAVQYWRNFGCGSLSDNSQTDKDNEDNDDCEDTPA